MAAPSLPKPQPQAPQPTTTTPAAPSAGPALLAQAVNKMASTRRGVDVATNNNIMVAISDDNPAMPPTPAPPLKFINVAPGQRLPLPASFSDDDPELAKRAAEMVRWAISSKHENSVAAIKDDGNAHSSRAPQTNGATTEDVVVADGVDEKSSNVRKAAAQHALLIDLLRHKTEPPRFLAAVLRAIACSNHGRELDRLVTHSKLHARLMHNLLGMDPFVPPSSTTNELRRLDEARRERREDGGAAAASSPASSRSRGVQISETSIRHKEDARYVLPVLPYYRYEVADVYLHLLVTLVSNNSILGMSAVRSVWVLLTDFGSRWLDWGREDVEHGRNIRKARRQRRSKQSRRKSPSEKIDEKTNDKEGEDADEGSTSPPTKRRKIETLQQPLQESVPVSQSPQSMASTQGSKVEISVGTIKDDKDEEEDGTEPESKRPVPGMSGLSTEFVRDALYGDNKGETGSMAEDIYSDRFASGRVQRLLLTLANIFRLCPRSKIDLQRLMSSGFPHHKTAHLSWHKWYTHSCLQMVRLSPTFEGPVLRLLVDKALDMDVEIKINEKGLVSLASPKEEGENNDVHQTSSDVSLTTKKRSFQQISQISLTGNNPVDSLNKTNNNETTSITDEDEESDSVIEISERLDSLMTALHSYILRATTFNPNSLPSAMAAVIAARRLYRHLDSVFDAKVRTTDRSKFVQFAFFVLFGRENKALEAVGLLMVEREQQQQQQQQQRQQQLDYGMSGMVLTTEETGPDNPDIGIPTSVAPINVTDPLYRGFSAKLIDFFYNPGQTTDVVPRQTAVCYLASFVSRATYVCSETVCECIAALLRWAEAYIEVQPSSALAESDDGVVRSAGALRRQSSMRSTSSSRNGNIQHQCEMHALFYTVCQAAFYIMCFRGCEGMGYYLKALRQKQQRKDDDVGDPQLFPEPHYADLESVDIGPKRWKFLCGHALQPLKYCLESVRSEFLHLANRLDLFLEPGTHGDSVGDGDEMKRREEANKFVERLWSTSSSNITQDGELKKSADGLTVEKTRRHSMTPMKKPGVGGVRRRRRTIISTAATREKKRLDGGVGGLGRGSNPLDSFFPFDPYLLQTSYEQVRPYYRNWEDCILTMEGEEYAEAENENVEQDEDPIVCMDDDTHSELSHLEEEEDIADREDAESDCDNDNEKDGYEQQHSCDQSSKPIALINEGSTITDNAASGVVLLREDDHFEMEIRRSRAMSTGSQCSW